MARGGLLDVEYPKTPSELSRVALITTRMYGNYRSVHFDLILSLAFVLIHMISDNMTKKTHKHNESVLLFQKNNV